MYTIDDKNQDVYDDEYYESSFWNNNKGLIIKIIIIILCVIVLIWLFKALKTSRNVNDENIHAANVLKVRLAAEDYFFNEGNKEDTRVVNLATLKNKGLIGDVVDANEKVCSTSGTNATLTKDVDAYEMDIKLDCSTNDKVEKFYYHNNTLVCLNCNGQTKVDSKVINKEEDKKDNGGGNNDNNVVPVNNNDHSEYSCANWSDWTKNRVYNTDLKERSKTLVRGVKYQKASRIVYGEWSDYTTTPITANDNLEVETKTVTEEVWSNPKTTKNIKTSQNVRITNTWLVNDYDTCKNGFIENDVCYSNKVKVGNLTFKEYNSGNYKVQNEYCEGIQTLKNSEGKYVLTYVNCRYNEVIDTNVSANSYYTVYEYQTLEKQNVTYYRSRSKTIVNDESDAIYTNDKYEEKYLPEGYVKLPGSEEVYYSYKYATCEK